MNTKLLESASQKINICSFFSGLGFLDLGFEKEGYEIKFVNEIHTPFLDAYRFARKKMKVVDSSFYSNASIEELLSKKDKAADETIRAVVNDQLSMFIGGPPCPDFSVAGKNKGKEGENGRLSQTYIDLICMYEPTFFLFENVKGLWRTKRHREFYDSLKLKLKKKGYVLTDRLTNALEFGVAQDRDRIFLVGVKKEYIQTLGLKNIDDFNWEKHMRYAGARDMPKKSLGSSTLLPQPLSQELTIQYWFDKNKVESHPNSTHGFTPRAALKRFETIIEGDDSKKSFKRLHRNRYSPTAAYGNNEVHIHPVLARRITAAEALSIQSLPKNFQLPPYMTLTNMFKGIGNGVPFLLAKGLAKTIREYFVMK